MLAGCRCKNITEYHGSVLKPRSTELMIVMELMACSVADLVGVSTRVHAPAHRILRVWLNLFFLCVHTHA